MKTGTYDVFSNRYGDKAPKTWIGRIFASIWIMCGITLCSMLTASLTNVITSAGTSEPPDLNGMKV